MLGNSAPLLWGFLQKSLQLRLHLEAKIVGKRSLVHWGWELNRVSNVCLSESTLPLPRKGEHFPDQRHAVQKCVDGNGTQPLRHGPGAGGEADLYGTGPFLLDTKLLLSPENYLFKLKVHRFGLFLKINK